MRRPFKFKLDIRLIVLAATAAVLVATILPVTWHAKWKKDPVPPVVETDTSAFSQDFFGAWHTEDGKKEHSLNILPNGYAIYKKGSAVDTLRYSSDETNTITIWIDGYVYDLTLKDQTLVRYRKGKPDGYTYHKH